LGKRALFWRPAGDVPAGTPLGRRAFYSDAKGEVEDPSPLRRGPILVTCSACGTASRVGLVDFVLYQLPFALYWPRRRFDHLMTCPACRRRVWASVTLRRA